MEARDFPTTSTDAYTIIASALRALRIMQLPAPKWTRLLGAATTLSQFGIAPLLTSVRIHFWVTSILSAKWPRRHKTR
jgi:hypothetical protein